MIQSHGAERPGGTTGEVVGGVVKTGALRAGSRRGGDVGEESAGLLEESSRTSFLTPLCVVCEALTSDCSILKPP